MSDHSAESTRPVHAPGVPCGAVVTPDDLVTSHRLFVTCWACLESIPPQRDWDAEPTLYDPDTGTHEA